MLVSLFAHPGQAAVAAVIHMYDDLVSVSRILPYAAHAELEQFEVVPGRDDDGKHLCITGSVHLKFH